MQRSFLDYAMSVIVGRALPDVRDGLKPVHIRILYAMYDGGYRPDRGYFKCARVVGDVMGNYHPHGDSAIYDTLVRMAQTWAMRMPLIDGQGNFGSPGNDPAAAMRYTECRLTPAGHGDAAGHRQGDCRFPPELRRPVRRAGGPARPVPEPARQRLGGHRGGDGHQDPAAQPARGRRRRAVVPGRTSRRPTRSCSTRCSSTSRARTSRPRRRSSAAAASRRPTAPGRGSITMRAVVEVEEDSRGRICLVVTELPFQVNPDSLALKIAELATTGRIPGIAEGTGREQRPGRPAPRHRRSSATPWRRSC